MKKKVIINKNTDLMNLKNILKNWKTTSTGVVMCVGAIVTYLNDKSQLLACLATFLGGVGLIISKDYDQTGLSK